MQFSCTSFVLFFSLSVCLVSCTMSNITTKDYAFHLRNQAQNFVAVVIIQSGSMKINDSLRPQTYNFLSSFGNHRDVCLCVCVCACFSISFSVLFFPCGSHSLSRIYTIIFLRIAACEYVSNTNVINYTKGYQFGRHIWILIFTAAPTEMIYTHTLSQQQLPRWRRKKKSR